MTIEQLETAFERYADEYLDFELVENRLSNRSDLHAFLLLDKLVPGDSDMIIASEHDEIFLSVPIFDLAKAASQDHIRELIRCGVRYDPEALCMFV